jgi:hypothetical protein
MRGNKIVVTQCLTHLRGGRVAVRVVDLESYEPDTLPDKQVADY